MDKDLAGKVVVITGASSGFGKGAALEFARCGAMLALGARRDNLVEDIARECEALGVRAVPVAIDVSIPNDVEQLGRAALDGFGRLDVWVNNAGVGALGRFDAIPLDIHEQVIRTDLLGTLYGSHFAFRRFVEQRHGVLINIASELGQYTLPYYSSYSAAKHGVVGLSTAMRQELQQGDIDDVHVCVVMPSAHDTPFFDHAANYTGHEVQAPAPLHDPKEVVDAIVELARDPKNSKIVGGDGLVKIVLKKIAPAAVDKMMGSTMEKIQIEKAPPAPPSPGAVEEPMLEGTEISGGRGKGKSPL